jgi:hypothetical protein
VRITGWIVELGRASTAARISEYGVIAKITGLRREKSFVPPD